MVVKNIKIRAWFAVATILLIGLAVVVLVVVLLSEPQSGLPEVQAPSNAVGMDSTNTVEHPDSTVTTGGSESSSIAPSIAIIASSLATLSAVAVAFYLYRWRRIVTANNEIVVPEGFSAVMATHDKHLQSVAAAFNSHFGHFSKILQVADDRLRNLIETTMLVQNSLDERDAEIQRLKRGYDAEIFRKFIGRFLRVDATVRDLLSQSDVSSADLEQLQILLRDALEECSVEIYSPNIGEDFRRAFGVAENPRTTPPNSPEDQFRIAEVIEPGYRLRRSDGEFDIVKLAIVRIFGATSTE